MIKKIQFEIVFHIVLRCLKLSKHDFIMSKPILNHFLSDHDPPGGGWWFSKNTIRWWKNTIWDYEIVFHNVLRCLKLSKHDFIISKPILNHFLSKNDPPGGEGRSCGYVPWGVYFTTYFKNVPLGGVQVLANPNVGSMGVGGWGQEFEILIRID